MIDMTPLSNVPHMTIPDLVDFLKYEPDGLFRVFLKNGKMYQAIKSKGEVTTVMNTTGYIFRRAEKKSNSYVSPEWVHVGNLEDTSIFLLIAQVKGWI